MTLDVVGVTDAWQSESMPARYDPLMKLERNILKYQQLRPRLGEIVRRKKKEI